MNKKEIEKRFIELDSSFGADNLRILELVIKESQKRNISKNKMKGEFLYYIPSLNKLNEKASFELNWLNKNFFETSDYNSAIEKVYNLKERIDRVKKVLLGEDTNK